MKRTTKNPAAKPRRPREKVLVVLHADGFVEAYAERHVDVHIVNRLQVEDERGELATAVDEYMEATLPRKYRGLNWPNKLRAIGNMKTITPETALDTLYQLHILRGLTEKRQPPAAIQRARRAG